MQTSPPARHKAFSQCALADHSAPPSLKLHLASTHSRDGGTLAQCWLHSQRCFVVPSLGLAATHPSAIAELWEGCDWDEPTLLDVLLHHFVQLAELHRPFSTRQGWVGATRPQ
jgi:hypothetical protein